MLVDIHPALDKSVLINNLKTASARRARNRFADHLARFYGKPLFWSRAYFVGSVGGATLETVRAYVEAQGTEELFPITSTTNACRSSKSTQT
jgi:putative transposase